MLSRALRCSVARARVGFAASCSGSTSGADGSVAGSTTPASAARCTPAPVLPSALEIAALIAAETAVPAFARSITGYAVPPIVTSSISSSGSRLEPVHCRPARSEAAENDPPGAISGCDGSPGASSVTNAFGTAVGAALPASGSVKRVMSASRRAAGFGPPGSSSNVSPTPSWGVTPSAAVVCVIRTPNDDAPWVRTGTDQVVPVPEVVLTTAGAGAPSSPARWPIQLAMGAGDPVSSDRSHVAIAVGSSATCASGNAGSDPSRPSSGIRFAASAAASPVAVPLISWSFSRTRPRISWVASPPS